jgi:hypothetical protein
VPFSFAAISDCGLRGECLAKSFSSFKKRKKELARKLKQEQKRQRKLDKDKTIPGDNSLKSQGEIENLQA